MLKRQSARIELSTGARKIAADLLKERQMQRSYAILARVRNRAVTESLDMRVACMMYIHSLRAVHDEFYFFIVAKNINASQVHAFV